MLICELTYDISLLTEASGNTGHHLLGHPRPQARCPPGSEDELPG